MSIEQSQSVDFIGTESDGKTVTLTATDHLEWGNNEHLLLLQEKMNSYLAFIESGEVFESYPEAKGKILKISIVCKHKANKEGEVFLAKCQEVIEGAGIKFEYRTHEI